jgi:PTH1 family peptidyl-tRNA hydrolase
VVDAVRDGLTNATAWRRERDAEVAATTSQPRVFLLKPQTFMNQSGQPIARFVNFYKIPLDRLWVVHDDVDLRFSELRLAFDRGSAGHQGVESVINALGSKAFHRLRLGVGSNRDQHLPAEDYVLQNFTVEEEKTLIESNGVISKAAQQILAELKALS